MTVGRAMSVLDRGVDSGSRSHGTRRMRAVGEEGWRGWQAQRSLAGRKKKNGYFISRATAFAADVRTAVDKSESHLPLPKNTCTFHSC